MTLLVILTVMLAACGGGPAAPAEEPTEATTAEEATPEEEMTGEEATPEEEMMEEETPEETGAAGEFEGTIKIATQSPLSGPQAAIGIGISNAAELGVAQLAGPLEEMGFTVALEPFDDQAQPEVGSANANNIISDPDILCVDGHYNSGVALAALPTYESANLAMVSPANTAPAITEDFPNAFRIVGRDDLQGPIGAQFADEGLNAETIYIVHDQTDYGQGIAEFFRQEAESRGITIQGFEGTQETSVFDSILTPIQAQTPDAIYFAGIFSQAGPFFAQARDRGIQAEFLGPDGLDNSELAELAGEAVAGMHYTSVAAPVSQFPDAAQFAQDYEAEYGEPAPPFSAQAYDVVGICVEAIANAAETAGGKPSREQVVEALRELQSYEGITGTYTFDEDGDPDPATYYVLQVNVDDWNANEVASRIESSPPPEEGAEEGDTEMTEEEMTEEEMTEEEMTEEGGEMTEEETEEAGTQ
jgi:branched-chain amino acid transport system substrate-binding protein